MKFQKDYCDEYGDPIVFYVGRLEKNIYVGRPHSTIYIWALNEFFEERFLLIGFEDDDGNVVKKAKRLTLIFNRKAKKFMVLEKFDDWIEELNESEQLQIKSSSNRNNLKIK